MKYLLLSLLVLSTAAMSADNKMMAQSSMKSKAATPDKTLDVQPEGKEKGVADDTALYANEHDMKANVTCKTQKGVELKQGDKGYEACLKNVKHKKGADVKVEVEKK